MKLLFKYLGVLGLAILGAVIIISYQSYKAKHSNQSVERYIKPLTDSKLNALVIDKSVTDASDRIQSSNAMIYSLKVKYIDLKSGQSSSFVMNFHHGKDIAPGDTITKMAGDEVLVLHKKEGEVFTLPVR